MRQAPTREASSVARLQALAAAQDVAPAVLAIAWCLRNPKLSSALLGCSSQAQLEENLGALALAGRLDAATMAQLDALAGA